jgi:uncharacterized protein
MKLHLASSQGLNLFTACDADAVAVNGQSFSAPVAVMPERIISPWTTHGFDTLNQDDFAVLTETGAAIILLGTGRRGRFPAAALMAPLINAGRGIEIMDTAAACRTFNILAAEGRQVVAALLFD